MDKTTFHIALAQAQANAPDHHLHRLIKGYNLLSVAYLKKILDTMDIPSEVTPTEEATPIITEQSTTAINEHYHKLKNLFIDRAKLSNTFHDVITDEDRAAISRKIQATQASIAMEMRAIAHIKQYGVAPVTVTGADIVMPENDYELFKTKELLRQSLSRGRINLKKKQDQGQDTTRQTKFLNRTQSRYDAICRCIAERGLQ